MLQHVSLEIAPDQADAAVEFWELLGFARVDSPEALGGYVTWLERVREAGFVLEDHQDLWGARRWFVIGPGGHRTELMESPPPPSSSVGDGG